MDKPRAYVEDLELGKPYIESNPWHWDYEYGTIWYVGTSYNKYDELVSVTVVEISYTWL